jgi:hypothetical protein
MKKLYFLAVSLLLGAGAIAQTNLSFENWTTGAPNDWDYYGQGVTVNDFGGVGDLTDENGDPVIPIFEMTDVPTDGVSYMRMTSFLMSNSNQPTNIPDGPYGSVNWQLFASTDKYEDVSFDVKYDVLGSDEAVLFVQASDANGDAVGQGFTQLTGSQANFATETVTINYFTSEPIVEYELTVAASIKAVFTTLGGNPTPAPEPGSMLDVDNIVMGNILIDAPNVTNIVASDISDNGDGSDLQATFDVPADESDIANYWLVATAPGVSPGILPTPLAFFQANGIQVTPNGSSQTVNFAAGDVYYFVNGMNVDNSPIVENEEMIVWVYVEGQNGANDVFASSNNITLTSSNVGLTSENVNKISVYPNPATNKVNFAIPNAEGTLTITSVTGQTVVSKAIESNLETVSIHNLNNGVYIYRIENSAGELIKTSKLVINK